VALTCPFEMRTGSEQRADRGRQQKPGRARRAANTSSVAFGANLHTPRLG
jgi:hypothetical protein